MKKSPIKRNKGLIPVSRDHHHGLLLCWKIRTGFSKDISTERIKRYTDWFFETHLMPHFDLEEKHIFPILGNQHELVKKALAEHRSLIALFTDCDNIEHALHMIVETLQEHIRFEERVLFQEIQEVATEEQLNLVGDLHKEEDFLDNLEDEFWA
ncbi:hemerythrin domain-containing protein [Maribacter polysaccharolyticus]|uniref:hemerythrin domain-containing protein n=1 Tax=Maribacter polysaccharolyticus TaxID=3020831 RepID=UPI00237F8A6D|nr:hemerythrin domain-containing protein [Maribacter polysaccharolyticus]MDE3742600.1 hemerythrin domain-containing protein [Maribacter polysaccharolyticus]